MPHCQQQLTQAVPCPPGVVCRHQRVLKTERFGTAGFRAPENLLQSELFHRYEHTMFW